MRAGRAQSAEALASALKDFRTHMARGLEMLEAKGKGQVSPQPSAVPTESSGNPKPTEFPLSQSTWDKLAPEDQAVWLD